MNARAAARWASELAAWAIPEHILHAAPRDPHRFAVERFSALAAEALRQPPTVTHERARTALPAGGSVLDVGCGGGAASLPLVPPALQLIGVDASAGMLDAFTHAAGERGAAVRTVVGPWPEVAAGTPVADVVVCAHVVYNVADLPPFVRALTDHARRRVVLELPEVHPLAWLTPYWAWLHGLERPSGPTGDDALAVVAGTGVTVHDERWLRPNSLHGEDLDAQAAFVRERLGLTDERSDEVRAAVERFGVPAQRPVITAWWDAPAQRPAGEAS